MVLIPLYRSCKQEPQSSSSTLHRGSSKPDIHKIHFKQLRIAKNKNNLSEIVPFY